MNDKVSIYIPTKNRLDFLKKAIDSVLNQTYENWELIVVNDASTDDTKDYLDKLTSENPKVKAIHHKESLGACVSRNDAIFSATGEFITGLDDDDEFTDDRLEKFLQEWEKNDNIIALCSYKNIISNGIFKKNSESPLLYISQNEILYKNLVGNQIFIKTQTLKNIGGFDKDFKMWQDYNCWYRLLSGGKLIKKIPYATYNWENSERVDRITQYTKEKTLSTYKLFVKKSNLNFRQANILKFTLVDYHLRKYDFKFYLEMMFGTFFDAKTMTIINNKFLKPIIYNGLRKFKLIIQNK